MVLKVTNDEIVVVSESVFVVVATTLEVAKAVPGDSLAKVFPSHKVRRIVQSLEKFIICATMSYL